MEIKAELSDEVASYYEQLPTQLMATTHDVDDEKAIDIERYNVSISSQPVQARFLDETVDPFYVEQEDRFGALESVLLAPSDISNYGNTELKAFSAIQQI